MDFFNISLIFTMGHAQDSNNILTFGVFLKEKIDSADIEILNRSYGSKLA